MAVEAAKIEIDVTTNAGLAADKMGKLDKNQDKVIANNSKMSKSMKAIPFVAVAAAGVLAFKKLADSTKENVRLYAIQDKAEKKLRATLKATGNAAGFSASQLLKQASALQKVTTFGDEAIISSQSILATFKSIKGQTFERATESILDLSAAFGQDLKGSAIQVGKALEDPTKGISALNRIGVTFSDTQKEQIRLFQEGGDIAKAQAIILETLEGQVGGVARAMVTGTGKLEQWKNEIGDSKEVLGKFAVSLIDDLSPAIEAGIKLYSRFALSMSKSTEDFDGIASAQNAIAESQGKINDINAIDGLIKDYEELSNKTTLSADEQVRLEKAIKGISASAPEAITQIDEYGRVLGISAEKAKEYSDALKSQRVIELQNAISGLNKEQRKSQKASIHAANSIEYQQKKLAKLEKKANGFSLREVKQAFEFFEDAQLLSEENLVGDRAEDAFKQTQEQFGGLLEAMDIGGRNSISRLGSLARKAESVYSKIADLQQDVSANEALRNQITAIKIELESLQSVSEEGKNTPIIPDNPPIETITALQAALNISDSIREKFTELSSIESAIALIKNSGTEADKEQLDVLTSRKTALEEILGITSETNEQNRTAAEELNEYLTERSQIEAEIEAIKALGRESESGDSEALNKRLGQLNEILSTYDKIADKTAVVSAKQKEAVNDYLNAISAGLNVFTAIGDAAEAFGERDIARLKAQGASEETLDKKRKELRRKAAAVDKAAAIFNAGINTAVAITSALTIPPPAGFILAGLAGAAGAAEIAGIAATPLPAANFGGSFTVPPGNEADSGLVRVNSGERVDVTPTRNSDSQSQKEYILRVGSKDMRAWLQDELDGGNITITRRGTVRA